MVFLFLLAALSLVFAYCGLKKTTMAFLLIGFALGIAMLVYHMTDTLRINL